MYTLNISPSSCRSDAEVEALRGSLPVASDYDILLEGDVKVNEPRDGVLARLVPNCLSRTLVEDTAKFFRKVHGDISNRGSIIARNAMLNRERKSDGSLSHTKAVPQSLVELVRIQNARLGLTGPYSDYLGYVDETTRQPFCRPTAWSLECRDIFEISKPLVEAVEYVNKHELPLPWKRQREFMKHVAHKFKYPDSMFSTVTVNLNVACAYHTDDGDFRGGIGNLVVLELGHDNSGILVMPRERVAFLVRPTDLLLMNVHHMHGNLPLTVGGIRLTAVLYARERINACGK